MTPYPHLFTPIKIGGQLIKNRIFSAPTGLMSYTARGHLTTENMAYYELKAKGGCGVVTLGESIVHAATGQSHDRQICLDDPHVLPSLTNTARAITRYGAVANIELSHGGKYAGLASIGGHKKERRPAYGPSHDVLPSGEEVLEMPQKLIYEILDAYGAAADVAKRAGFGMVMVHAGHGWLFNQFLSPLENRRKDEFGGSLENRARFLLMALDRVRQAVGPGFPIQIRMNGDDFTEGGLHLEDYKELARMVESRVDLFNISCGSHERQELFVRTHPSAFLDHGCNVYLAAAIKQVVSKPVSCVGALGDPEQCEEIIASGQADIVELGRALLADPFLPKKAYTGQKEDITPCLRCFVCLGESEINGTNRCSVNPVIGAELEEKYYVAPPLSKKKVLVVGGGPAGMEAAITAARRGHEVLLYEKTDALGGALKFAEAVPFKQDLYRFTQCLIRRVESSGVKVTLNQRVDRALAEKVRPDVLIIAVGAQPVIPAIPGIASDKVVSVAQAEANPDALGERVVILGGGLVGCETGIHLGMKGKQVTIVEMRDTLAADVNMFHGMALGQELNKYVTAVTGGTGRAVTDEGLVYTDREGQEHLLPADAVLCAVGMRACTDVMEKLWNVVDEQYVIGDCVKPAQVTQAISDAYYLAKNL
ncbi:FAD-dependent oxidoreductase [Flavonifractor plautii]|uniref:oxidoreductase n=1 Tax=Flavonifractor plautii TaxID=292800 RepID=UPI0018AB6F4C|nr:FAD-dependent oxidoreductase [Flavonifractor plautii]MDB7869119.1 FAD-dependent oxidoreductase [Flavonifractor plautii]MDB7873084.1 FAD-dependent oxidoreductase [Flavonifractor plautii]MDB7883815.1 FAD-dependent oxidoreductase [Flavonifractor plautii]